MRSLQREVVQCCVGDAALDEFDLDKNNPKIALTRRNGFFQENQEDPATHRRLDRIHLGLGFFASRVTPDFAAFIILHELSHFVGRANGQEIHDFGRGSFNEPFIAPLKAAQRLANADSYGNAWPTNRTSRRSWKAGPAASPARVRGVHRRSVVG